MLRHRLTLALTAAGLCASSAAAPQDWPLRQALGPAVKLQQLPRRSLVEYCPDNTCDRFEAKGPKSLALLHDFAYLYLYAHGQYLYLADFKASPSAYASEVVGRHSSSCLGAAVPANVTCVLKLLQRQLGITYAFVRYDEGHRCTVPESLLGVPSNAKSKCTKVRGAA